MTDSSKRNIGSFRIGRTILVMLMLVLVGLTACRHAADPRLSVADSLLEEHPDSALMLMESYRLPDKASDHDRALYGMLLTHARYKNFIDETDDSLISKSADYFVREGIDSMAARALFLTGMMQMNSNRLGDAAVSFSKGLDLARASHSYMWEGRCAMGLENLYQTLCNGSSQIKYAQEAHDAFVNGGWDDWANYSKLRLACAFHNNGQYDKSLEIADEVLSWSRQEKDTLLIGETLQLKGLTLFCLRNYIESINNYVSAYEINNSALTEFDRINIIASLNRIPVAIRPDITGSLAEILNETVYPEDAFVALSDKGDYKAAYEGLDRYRNLQDSVLNLILENNVSESIDRYLSDKNLMEERKRSDERRLYLMVMLAIAAIGVTGIWIYREGLHKERERYLKMVSDMESLRSDLTSQLENKDSSTQSDITPEVKEVDEAFIRIIRQRYAEINELCDDHYQGKYTRNGNGQIISKMTEIIGNFTDKSNLVKIEEYVDANTSGMYSSFKQEFFDVNEENRRLFLYLCLGFTSRTISVFLNQNISVVYTKKSRLKNRIASSSASRKEDYLSMF